MAKRAVSGQGSLHQLADGRWRWKKLYDTPQGKKLKTFTYKRQRDVLSKRDKWEEDLREWCKTRTRPSEQTLAEYLPDWLEHTAKPNIAKSTYRRYEYVVRCRLIPTLGGIKLKDLSAQDVRAMKAELLGSLAPDTVRYVQGVLSTALNQAVSDGVLASNPSSRVKKAKSRGQKMRPLTQEQSKRLIESVKGTRWEALYTVAIKLGPRQGELAGLFWSDIDFEKKILYIERSVTTNVGGNEWGTTKTGKGRTIRLPESVLDALKRHRSLQLEERLSCREWGDERLVFPNGKGRVYRAGQMRREFKSHLAKAGLPEVRIHDLRHSAITIALGLGIDIPTVSQMVGHMSPRETLDRYSHVLESMQDSAAAKLDALPF